MVALGEVERKLVYEADQAIAPVVEAGSDFVEHDRAQQVGAYGGERGETVRLDLVEVGQLLEKHVALLQVSQVRIDVFVGHDLFGRVLRIVVDC